MCPVQHLRQGQAWSSHLLVLENVMVNGVI